MIDRVEIKVAAGAGGAGAISFRHEKFVPYGGPDGGDGGDGGNVIIMAEAAVSNLRRYQAKKFYRAGNGGQGRGQKKHGKTGEDVILTVPPGTVVSDKASLDEALMADLEQPGQQAVVAKGGRGGSGNVHFSSSTNQAPKIAQRGEAGEEATIILEMRLIADTGIIGYPNVGKSTLLAAASAAKPEIASYPFTTREPILGVVEVGQESLVLAEIPGLIEDAHLGRGLGHHFLRHILRTKILIHLVDGSAESPVEDMIRVNTELGLFDSALAQKPQVVAVNKVDLPQVKSRIDEIKDAFGSIGIKAFFISAATGEGVEDLMAGTMQLLSQVTAEKAVKEVPRKVFRPQPRASRAEVRKEGDTFVLTATGLERLMVGQGVTGSEARWQLRRQLVRKGLAKTLEKAGIRPGDRVRCGNIELEW